MKNLFLCLTFFILGNFENTLHGGEEEAQVASAVSLETITTPIPHQDLSKIPEECEPHFRQFFETGPLLCQKILDRTVFETAETRMKLLEDLSKFLSHPDHPPIHEMLCEFLGRQYLAPSIPKWKVFRVSVENYLENREELSETTRNLGFLDPLSVARLNLDDLNHSLVWEIFRFYTMLVFLDHMFNRLKGLISGGSKHIKTLENPLIDRPCGLYLFEESMPFFLNVTRDSSDAISAGFVRILLGHPDKTQAIEAIRSYLKSDEFAHTRYWGRERSAWYRDLDCLTSEWWEFLGKGDATSESSMNARKRLEMHHEEHRYKPCWVVF